MECIARSRLISMELDTKSTNTSVCESDCFAWEVQIVSASKLCMKDNT